ncbi:hypothetical protein CcaverHIS002_0400910 [Cutaneotrichosporon cavernicola]|uniref:CSN8/PSMD8/EIF3K domain-containing protein n=1 Tax=Cutaneotrichosporon cavernicola TaxID=279322 RepID=A0AA48L3I4_9TREE|nr:uncharacterized protein CcaverHIS019_0400870 [Cutaneotrichosporon cavernicola]BEI83487.1 hypothetical protein CcaverHIS002_0400910 [Cutaneotrichosporon cavernicola]BEI91267.1 hypothetical protein CcaverHIS019_0400870 [Cutaneotrichosporon cavernicola]BEI99040.1 hypothetical protein CcaverHIS631_0400830 [Cutaneotrichosporon cavernicola]BEJ06814.1 hypothetical protein CcaverHIS641_0400830 [Cutaneotrichosporon cavernicola]
MSLDLQESVSQLQKLFDAGNKDEVAKLATQLKIKLAQSGLYFAPPNANVQDLLAARSILEIAAFNALRRGNLAGYAQYNAALQPFYVNLANTLTPSPNRPIIIGLELLAMLSEGKYSQFHMTLEALDIADLGDVFVRWPVDLERWMMEGAYNKIYRARERVPREEYAVLLDRLMGTIREQIALTIETSYPSLPLANAAQLLFFKDGETSLLVQFTVERGWSLEPSTQTFTFPKSPIPDIALAAVAAHGSSRIALDIAGGKGIKRGAPMQSMIRPALELTHELESIV